MTSQPDTPSATEGDRELAAAKVSPIQQDAALWAHDNWNEGKKIAGADSGYVAFWAYVAGAESACRPLREEIERLTKDRDEWRDVAKRTDAKMLHEQADHNKTIDGPLAAARSRIASLEAEVARKDGALRDIEYRAKYGTSALASCKEIRELAEHALSSEQQEGGE